MPNPTYLDLLRAASEGATAGPCEKCAHSIDDHRRVHMGNGRYEIQCHCGCPVWWGPNPSSDARFFALARNCFDELLGVVEAAQATKPECVNFNLDCPYNCYVIDRQPYLTFPCLACALERLKAKVTDA